MKYLIFTAILFFSAFQIKAQNNIETIYLKDGSIINGIIIEQIPNRSFTIQTRDGNIFVFQIENIDRITRLQANNTRQIGNNGGHYIFIPGYKGFVDFGYTFGTGDYGYDRIEFSTSHGYQFNPYFYLGVGAGLNYFTSPEICSVPIFANARLTLPINRTINPFFDLKTGYTVSRDVKGFYLSPSVGARFDIGNDKAINLSAGYTYQNAEYAYYGYYSGLYSKRQNCGGVTLKLGLEF